MSHSYLKKVFIGYLAVGCPSLMVMLALAILGPVGASSLADTGTPTTLSEAIGFLAREKTVGESGVAILKSLKSEITRMEYLQGFKQYAQAKAKFDGVIRQLEAEFTQEDSPQTSTDLQHALQAAAEERITFTKSIDQLVEKQTVGGKAVPFVAIFTTVAALLEPLTNSVIKIWQEYRQASTERRQEIQRQLQDVTWRPFNDIEAIE